MNLLSFLVNEQGDLELAGEKRDKYWRKKGGVYPKILEMKTYLYLFVKINNI